MLKLPLMVTSYNTYITPLLDDVYNVIIPSNSNILQYLHHSTLRRLQC